MNKYSLLTSILLVAFFIKGGNGAKGVKVKISKGQSANNPGGSAPAQPPVSKKAVSKPNCLDNNSPASDCFDLLKLVMVWPRGYAQKLKTRAGQKIVTSKIVNRWIIHGLWPQIDSGLPQKICERTDVKFDVDKLYQDATLVGGLKQNWLRVNGCVDLCLWEYQWEKHGTCSARLPEVNDSVKFLKKVLELFDKVNLDQIFSSNGFLPGSSKSFGEVNDILEKALRRKVVVATNKNLASGIVYITEILLCYDLSFKIMDCVPPKNEPDSTTQVKLLDSFI